jgi:hypothetical protein
VLVLPQNSVGAFGGVGVSAVCLVEMVHKRIGHVLYDSLFNFNGRSVHRIASSKLPSQNERTHSQSVCGLESL